MNCEYCGKEVYHPLMMALLIHRFAVVNKAIIEARLCCKGYKEELRYWFTHAMEVGNERN